MMPPRPRPGGRHAARPGGPPPLLDLTEGNHSVSSTLPALVVMPDRAPVTAPIRLPRPVPPPPAVRYERTMTRGQTVVLAGLLACIAVSGGALLWLLATRAHVTSPAAGVVLGLMLALESVRVAMGVPVALLALRACDPVPMRPARWDGRVPRVALTTTIVPAKEPVEVVRRTLTAMLQVRYHGPVDVWLLDEGDDPAVRAMCATLGVSHFTRKGRPDWNTGGGEFKAKTKGGNANAWRAAHGHRYNLVGQMDPNCVPEVTFLTDTVGYFNDPDTAFVVGPQIYGNGADSWIARGAGELETIFQGLVQRGANGHAAPLLIGTNHVYRMEFWEQIGGYQDTIVEDHLTGMAVYAAFNPATGNRLKGVYTPAVMSVGEGPSCFTDWFTQQVRWAYGVARVISGHSPRMLPKLAPRQRLSYALLQPFYPAVGLQWVLSAALTTAYMISGVNLGLPLREWAPCWAGSVASVMAFWLWSHRFNLISTRPGWTGLVLALMTLPVWAAAAGRWAAGRGLPYVVTPKGAAASGDRLRTFRPHLAWLAWAGALLGLAAAGVIHAWPLILFWAGVAAAISAAPVIIHLAGKGARRAA